MDQSTDDWYNITAIGKDEPLERTLTTLPTTPAPSLAQQRPSFRRSSSGNAPSPLSLPLSHTDSLLAPRPGGFSNRSVGDTTPTVLGRHKSAGQLNIEDLEDPSSRASGAATGAGK
jgi:hypothetical protein